MKPRLTGTFFVLSWTLTQVNARNVLFRPVKEMVEGVSPLLFAVLLGSCRIGVFPGALYEDFVDGGRIYMYTY